MGIFGLMREVWLGDKRTVGARAAVGSFFPDPSTYFPNFGEQLSARQSTVGGAAAGGPFPPIRLPVIPILVLLERLL